ncbi:MAG: ABC transporter ATP-binding protein [Geminicoccaceae bacterium]|jgi:multiple sugar transport system ATP-binding protein|nr:ABC transporter ATP-binding protein [Geminicoccaceae bacterium]HRY25662.1 ABC transporter ATP-binding protein [Geminicoccaceae bacterium]
MASVTIDHVWKYYGKTEAVKDLNLKCADGEFLSVLGPSGCGKSSTLRMLAGLEHISAGDIRFGERRINDLPPKDRDIAMVFENYALYPHKTVRENIANSLMLRGASRATIEQKVKKATELLQIGHLLQRKPQELSGGQKQRVAIGRAIVREPQLFLFDEPIAHLDAKLRAHMRGELKIMQRELGTTMIYVTHDQLEALSMADRIAVMHEGVLQQFGTPQEIYDHPVNEWVAGFVGEPPMNFVDCLIEDRGGVLHAVHPSFAVPVTGSQEAILRDSAHRAEVRMGIRPDQIGIVTGDGGDAVAAQILLTEPLGGDMLVDAAVGQEKFLVKTKPDFQGRRGDACRLAFDTGRWHLFDRDTGLAYF